MFTRPAATPAAGLPPGGSWDARIKTVEPTLNDRAGRMYRQLVILQRMFQRSGEADEVEGLGTGDHAKEAALWSAMAEMIDELTDHVALLTSIPFPISEWQSGDGPDDE